MGTRFPRWSIPHFGSSGVFQGESWSTLYGTQLFCARQDWPHFCSSTSLIADDCGWFSIWFRPWEDNLKRQLYMTQRYCNPMAITHFVRGCPRKSLCLTTAIFGETTIRSWWQHHFSMPWPFPWFLVRLKEAMNMATATRRTRGNWESESHGSMMVLIYGDFHI